MAPSTFEYLVREVATALVSLGRGMSYTDAAKQVRMTANVGKTAELREVVGGQTVAEWMADFVPVVTARQQPTEWPPVLVLDSTRFRWNNHGQTYDLFSVLGAYGYDENGQKGPAVEARVSTSERRRQLEGVPRHPAGSASLGRV